LKQYIDKNESIEFESKTIMPTVFMKEAEIKKVLGKERREFPISFTATNTALFPIAALRNLSRIGYE
jgi:hypothetical protein